MKYIAIIDADNFSNFKCFEDMDGKYLVAKDTNEEIDEWLPLHFTEIPDNATNGDIMNLMFDIVEDKHPDKGTINLYFFDLDIAIVVSLAWWNAPYQKGGK